MSDAAQAILVADDEESMRFFLKKTLRRAGFEVTAVEDGVAAVDAIERRPWSAILVDLKMPRLDGVGVLDAVRGRGIDVPVVLMTGYGSVSNALEAMKRGASDYVTKPFHADQIVETVRAAIARGRRPRSVLADDEPRAEAATLAAPWAGGAIGVLLDEARGRGAMVPPPSRAPTLREAVRVLEWIYVDEALRRSHGNVTAAARDAGISRPSFHRKMRELDVDAETYRR